jgi:hypothetical protein
MRLLLDECLPRRTKFLFAEGGHECETVRDAGFSSKENGSSLSDGFAFGSVARKQKCLGI